jgi:hypothetical protein
MVSYDMHIYGLEAWDELVQRNLGIVIDPLVYRFGQFFSKGRPVPRPTRTVVGARSKAISEPLSASSTSSCGTTNCRPSIITIRSTPDSTLTIASEQY